MGEQEFYQRYQIFQKNYKRILDHNAIEDSGFELEVNKFADLSDEEFISKYTGLIISPKRQEHANNIIIQEEAIKEPEVVGRQLKSLPNNKNWFLDGYVTQPYDQGMCGGCWAFSSSAATESLAYINKKVPELTEFSVQ